MSTAGTRTQRRELSVPKDWLADEEKYLKKNYGLKSYRTMGKELGRTPGAVKGKAKRMKLCGTAVKQTVKEQDLDKCDDATPVITVRYKASPKTCELITLIRRLLNPHSKLNRCAARNHYILRRAVWE